MDKLLSLLFFFWLLERNDNIQQLISKPHQRNSEIYDHSLTHDLGSVHRIGQFCGKVEFKVLIVINKVVSQLNQLLTCSFDDVLFKQWVNCRIKLLINVFKKTSSTSSNGILQIFDERTWAFIHV